MATAIGTIAARPLFEAVAEEFGWEALFYVAGSTTLYWFMLWSGLAFDAPETHPRIGFREKKYVIDLKCSHSLRGIWNRSAKNSRDSQNRRYIF